VEITILVNDDSGRPVDRVRGVAEPNLSESAWRRAKSDAAGVYSSIAFQTGGTLVTLIVGAVAAAISADESSTAQIAIPVLGGAVAIGMSFLAVLMFQVAAAPIRQRDALREAWPSAGNQSSGDTTVKLWNAYRQGRDLALRLDAQVAAERDWTAAERWANEVGALLAGAAPEATARAFFIAGENQDDLAWQVDSRASELKKIIEGLG
jgi:hypothetical protein